MIKLSSIEKLLAVFILFIVTLLVLRMMYANNVRYITLLWNLFLAWIPFQLSTSLTKRKPYNKWHQYFLLAAWLLFFPNALYIITDDAILLFTSSVTGLIMAFASLFKVEIFLQQKIKHSLVNRLIVGCLFVGSFGVYLGRFLRYNSWDIITDPLNLLSQVVAPFALPLQHYRTWGVTVLLTCLFSLLYFAVKKLPGLIKEPGNEVVG